MHSKNYKILMKVIEVKTNGWKESNIVKMTILSKAIYRFNAMHINDIFHRAITKALKFVWKHYRPQMAKTILQENNKARAIILLDFRLCSTVTVIKSVWYWHKTRHRSIKQDKTRGSKSMHSWSIINGKGKNTQWRKDSLFNKWWRKNWTATC